MNPLRIAYTVSSSYSGSTLLSMLLNTQPDIGTISEFDARGDILTQPDFMCSCGEPIRRCPFFTALEERVRAKGVDFRVDHLYDVLRVHPHPMVDRLLAGRLPHHMGGGRAEAVRDGIVPLFPPYRRLVERFFRRNGAVMESILELQNGRVFADANKEPQRMVLLARRFDVRPIYIYKNGVAGVYSMVKNAAKMKAPVSVARASRRWFHEQIAISRALRRMNVEALQLSYSDLCADVEGTMRRIAAFLGIDFVPFKDVSSTEHHIVGNRMRLTGVSEIREDVSWKENFSASDLEMYRRAYGEYAPRLRALNPDVLEHVWH